MNFSFYFMKLSPDLLFEGDVKVWGPVYDDRNKTDLWNDLDLVE